MVEASVLQRILLLLPFVHQPLNTDTNNDINSGWDYERNGADWEGTCRSGLRQSPINLELKTSMVLPLSPIVFRNYDRFLRGPLTLENNGHSVSLPIPRTTNGYKPYITGVLKGRYEAESLHFHWGSRTSRGSEHAIKGQRYDVEMHIIHRNTKYATVTEASQHSDGLAVLGVLFKIDRQTNYLSPAMRSLFSEVPNVPDDGDQSDLPSTFRLGDLIRNLNTQQFYMYGGSLTTPECNQAVTWIVFDKVLTLPLRQVAKLWRLHDSHGHLLRNNYRVIQPRNKRLVFYRTGKDLGGYFLGK